MNEDLRNIVIDSVQTIFNAFVVHVFEYVSFENFNVFVRKTLNVFEAFPIKTKIKNKSTGASKKLNSFRNRLLRNPRT